MGGKSRGPHSDREHPDHGPAPVVEDLASRHCLLRRGAHYPIQQSGHAGARDLSERHTSGDDGHPGAPGQGAAGRLHGNFRRLASAV